MAPRTRNVQAIRDLAERIKSVDDFDPYTKVLVYGPSGSGKTRFVASAPRVLIIDINEEGTRSAVGSGARKIEVYSWDDIGHAYWLLKSGKHKFESVGLDGITSMQNMAMAKVLGEAEDRDPARETSAPRRQDYGRCAELMRSMLLAYRNLPMNVIFTALPRVIRDEDTGETVEITVDLPAGSRGTAMGCVSVLGLMRPRRVRTRVEGRIVKRWIDTMVVGPDDVIQTKDRTNLLGDVITNPTMPRIIEAWNNSTPQGDDSE